jgi:hypothetical protein
MMNIKEWLIGMGWVVLCSTGLALANESEHSSDEAEHLDREDKKSSRRPPLHSALRGECNESSVDLTPLYSVLKDEASRDYVKDRSKHHRNALRLLWRYLFDISDSEYSEEESSEEESSEKEESKNEEESSEKEESKNDGKESGEEDWRDEEKLFPVTQRLKAKYALEERLRMNIDLNRLLEIENLVTLHTSKPFTSEEVSLLNKAIFALDRSPGRCLLGQQGF